MSNPLSGFDASGVTVSNNKKSYSLDETLAIMQMFKEGIRISQVSALTARSTHSLRYKFLEGEIILNGKKVQRSIRQYTTLEALYESFGVSVPENIESDSQARIKSFRSTLDTLLAAV